MSGEEMQRRRRDLGFAQQDVAKELGWGRHVITSLEADNPSPSREQFEAVMIALSTLDERRRKAVLIA